MEELYKLNVVRNSEIRFRWLRLNLRGKVENAVSGALEFVTEQGRMKFVRPIYRFVYFIDVYPTYVSVSRLNNNFVLMLQ